nr:YuzB family protein [Bacillus sp. 165]
MTFPTKKITVNEVEGGRNVIKPIVEFCVSNLANGSQKARETLEKDPDLDIIEYGCLGYCGICYESMFALVNGEAVTGETPDELIKNIYEYLEENPMF